MPRRSKRNGRVCCTCYWRREIRVAPVHVFFTFFWNMVQRAMEWFWLFSLYSLQRDCRTTLFEMARGAIAHDFLSLLSRVRCSLWSGQVGYGVFWFGKVYSVLYSLTHSLKLSLWLCYWSSRRRRVRGPLQWNMVCDCLCCLGSTTHILHHCSP